MSDDDWDADDFEVPTLAPSKFDDEEEEEEEEVVVKPKKPQKPTVKKVEKAPRNYDDPSDLFGMVDESQREALERTAAGLGKLKVEGPNLDEMPLKSLKDFKKYGTTLVQKHIYKHRKNKHYKELLKAIIREAALEMKASEVKELETGVVGLRQERVKEEKELKEKSKKGPKKQLNAGARGGQGSYGDAGYDDAGYDALDMDDFM